MSATFQRDLSALERKLAFHIGKPIAVIYGIYGSRRPSTGIIVSSKVYISDNGLNMSIPMKSHKAFDFVARRDRELDGGIPIDSIVRHMPDSLMYKLIRVGEFEVRRLRKELEKILADGPGELVDVTVQNENGNLFPEKKRADPLWQVAQHKSVADYEAVLKAEIAMLTEALQRIS